MTLKELSSDHLFTGLILFSCILILILVYGQTAVGFYQLWTGENSLQSHGLLLLPLSFYLLTKEWYWRRHQLQISFRPFLLLALSILSAIWLLSDIAQIQVGTQLVLITLLSVTVLALFGTKHTGRLVVPVLLLFSATSVWSVLSQPLQLPTAIFVNQMLHVTGYSSFQESYFITIPEGVFEVGDTCSGLRYQIAAVTLAILYSFFSHYSLRNAFIHTLLASGVAFISNSIRIYIVVLSGHYTNMTHSLLSDHIWLGWVVFAICYAGLMFATVSVEKKLKIGSKHDLEETDKVASGKISYSKTLIVASVLLLAASTGPIYSVIAKHVIGGSGNHDFGLNFNMNELSEVDIDERWNPIWVNADFEQRSAYHLEGIDVELYIAHYAEQEQGKEAVGSVNQAYHRDKWNSIERVDRQINLADGSSVTILEDSIVDAEKNELIVWHWYYIGGETTSTMLQSKLYTVLAALKGRHDAVVVAISTEKTGDGSMQREIMTRFTGLLTNKIDQYYTGQKN